MRTTHRKILVPLTTLLAAAAVAVGSGATFTSQSSNTLSTVASGTLSISNSKDDAAIFDLSNIKPGDSLEGSLTITNTGSLPATLSLTEVSSSNAFGAGNLTLQIENSTTGATVYSGAFGGLTDGAKNDLGVMQPDEAGTYVFTVSLDVDTPSTDQGKSAGAVFTWDAVQLDGTTTQQ